MESIQTLSLKCLMGLGFGVLIGCAAGNCRTVSDQNKTPEEKSAELVVPANTNSKTRISVYKYDGSLQCGMGKQIPIEIMKKELAGVQVFRAENKQDNLMHIQACGTPTGRANVYEIDRDSLEKVKKAGFLEWSFD